jgi:hypothetical protein
VRQLSEAFKNKLVQRMLSAKKLSHEMGIGQPTLRTGIARRLG